MVILCFSFKLLLLNMTLTCWALKMATKWEVWDYKFIKSLLFHQYGWIILFVNGWKGYFYNRKCSQQSDLTNHIGEFLSLALIFLRISLLDLSLDFVHVCIVYQKYPFAWFFKITASQNGKKIRKVRVVDYRKS